MKQPLAKLSGQMKALLKEHGKQLKLTPGFCRRLSVIENVSTQQEKIFDGEKVSGRIVSVDKPYIRPIVRGKETKTVEFGAKCNNIQIDGISFIEHIAFDTFNEGVRLKKCISLHQRLVKRHVRAVAADSIYGTNENRRFCTRNSIYTSFVRKGRPAKDEKERKLLRRTLSRERAKRLEGSFGTQKLHYSLLRVRATQAGNRSTLDIFRYPHCQRRKDDRENRKSTSERSSLISVIEESGRTYLGFLRFSVSLRLFF